MSEPKRKRSSRRILLNLLLLLVFLLLAAVLVGIYLADRPPDFYRSASQRDLGRLTNDAYDFGRKAQDFLSNVWSERDFPLEITEREINGYLAAVNDNAIWDQLPLKFESWRKIFTSRTMSNVQVVLHEDSVTVAGDITWSGYELVLSVLGTPQVESDGRVKFRVTGTCVGSLPLPRRVFGDLIARIEAHAVPSKPSRWRVVTVKVKDGKALLTGEASRGED